MELKEIEKNNECFLEGKGKLKIGIDIDDVLVDTSNEFMNFYNKKGLNLKLEEIRSFYFWDGMSKEKITEMFFEFNNSFGFKKIEFIDFAKEGVYSLKDKGNIWFITSRPIRIKEETISFICENFNKDNFEDILFSGKSHPQGKTKGDLCVELNLDIFIEDRVKYALDCAEKGVKVLLMNKPWNQHCPEHENIIRVNDWNEVLEKIKEIEEELVCENNVVNQVKDFVKECFNRPEANYKQSYDHHFIPMVDYSKKLADEFELNEEQKEVIEIAAWLHDIGSILYGRKDHHITGANVAEEKLKELDYPQEKIKLIKKCILNHRGSVNNSRKSIEEQIIAEADVLSNFDNIAGIFQAAYFWESLDQKEAQISVREKLKRKYNQLYFKKSRELVKPKFEAAMLLLGGFE